MANAIKPQVTDCTTEGYPFYQCDPHGTNLFTVLAGVDSGNALPQASCFIDSAIKILRSCGGDDLTAEAHGALYLLEMAQAVVNAATPVSRIGGADHA